LSFSNFFNTLFLSLVAGDRNSFHKSVQAFQHYAAAGIIPGMQTRRF